MQEELTEYEKQKAQKKRELMRNDTREINCDPRRDTPFMLLLLWFTLKDKIKGDERLPCLYHGSHEAILSLFSFSYLLMPSWTATATATVAPTMGLLPMPMRPIISTCAGTEEEPANCASECIRPIVSVMP